MEDCSKTSEGGRVADLPDDLLVEILSRVPAKSVCRFKCVSKAWCDLIVDPHHRKRLRQPMQGLFFKCVGSSSSSSSSRDFCFINVAATTSVPPYVVDHCFSFLTEAPGIMTLVLKDSCNGLVLFSHHQEEHHNTPPLGYIVCNPATKQWRAVPCPSGSTSAYYTYLAFDPAVSSHFRLVQFQKSDGVYMSSVHAYSSETGTWNHNIKGPSERWHNRIRNIYMEHRRAFVNGFLHLIASDWDERRLWDERRRIAVVDVRGKVRRMVVVPHVDRGGSLMYIGQSQGSLHCITKRSLGFCREGYELFIWVLQDYDTQQWLLKHTVSSVLLFGEKCPTRSVEVAGIHLDCNVVFFTTYCSNRKLIAYDMDRKEVSVINTYNDIERPSIVRYVPCFSELPALSNRHSK